MIKNYLTIAFRSFWKHKLFSFINLIGLSLGLACSLLIFLWVQDELRYDQFHTNKDRLFLLLSDWTYSDGSTTIDPHTPANLSAYLKDAAPEINQVSRMVAGWWSDVSLSLGENRIKQSGIYVDSTFLSMFTYPLREGDPAQALVDPKSIVISQEAAQALFPSGNALGNTVTLNDSEGSRDYQVTGILAQRSDNSSLDFDFLVPYPDLESRNEWLTKWGSGSVITLVELQSPDAEASVSEKIASLATEHQEDLNYQVRLFPYQDIHLRAPFRAESIFYQSDIAYVYLFSAVALLVLVIACINFVNLSTARASQRAVEVGIRKVVGAPRRVLVGQFMYESFLTVALALALAVLLIELALPLFNQMVAKELEVPYREGWFIGSRLGVMVLAVLLSGSYPALVLSSFKPIATLKGRVTTAQRKGTLRQILVVAQFVFSTILIVGTVTIYAQIRYIQEKNLGLDRHNVLSFSSDVILNQHFDTFKQDLLQNPAFVSVSRAAESPLGTINESSDPWWPGKAEDDNRSFYNAMVDYDFFETLGIKVVEGRSFAYGYDSVNYVLNEEAVRQMDLKNPIGTPLHFWQGKGKVIGVVKDFHHRSLREDIGPIVFMLQPAESEQAYARIAPGHTSAAVAALSEVYARYHPKFPVDFRFLDESFDQMYRAERRIGALTNAFTGLAIIISALGLLGMSTFAAQRRRKEIGVRKVLGAPVKGLLLLLSRDYIRLVAIALVIAIPLANYLLGEWLDQFAYHITLRWWMFALPALLVLIITLVSVSGQTVKAATQNPVDSLRYE
ncbi:MAG: ABC transporter permease [Cyclobacteriaceae bacterium]